MLRVCPAEPAHIRRCLLFVVVVVGLPLVAGLGRWDMGSDEAIYSYAVERVLETGDWLTPRSIPSDLPFFEKPPLKFWMVGGAMRAGVLPLSDAGMRGLDALFGVAAFGYVCLLGIRLAGPVCGIVATLILFAFGPLLFEHGLRSNNMEASLVLTYCGGVFHFVQWVGADRPRRRRLEALVVALYFVLGFMTKFVAALFLPMILGGSLLALEGGIRMLRQRWREWLVPVCAALVLIAPWFVYQSLQPAGGRSFWEVLVGVHVYQRLTGVLAPEHLAPWHYYVTSTWRELGSSQTRLLVVAGLGCLGYAAWREGRWPERVQATQADSQRLLAGCHGPASSGWLARVVLIWWLLPYAVMSAGTSKLLHYAYPFIPPLALGGGLACAWAVQGWRGDVLARRLVRIRERLRGPLAWAERRRSQQGLACAGLVLFGFGVWTAFHGPVEVDVGHVRVFRNGSVVRPLVFACLCLGLTRWGRRAGLGVAMAALLVVLPVDRYFQNVGRAVSVHHPLRTIRDCALDVRKSSPGVSPGALRASGDVLHHAYYYYMRHLGAWVVADPPSNDAALTRALGGEQSMPVFVTAAQHRELARTRNASLPGVLVEENVVALLPGPFEVCVPQAIAAGARPLR